MNVGAMLHAGEVPECVNCEAFELRIEAFELWALPIIAALVRTPEHTQASISDSGYKYM